MILCIDFDGTIVEDKYPDIGNAVPHIIDFIHKMRKEGHELILWTSRTDEPLQKAVDWCKEHGITFDAVNDNLPRIQKEWGGNTRKVYCDWYIDDKAIHPDQLINEHF